MPKLQKDDLIIRCAYLFFVDRLNIKDVASRLDISRFKVSRYLKEAEDRGLVEIRFNIPDMHYQTLAMDIEKKYGINRAIVVPVSPDMSPEIIRKTVGQKGASILREFDDDLTIGITWGRTIANMVEDLPVELVKFKCISELTGGFGMISPQVSTSSLAPLLAKKTQALCYQMHGPILSTNEKIAESLLADKSIIRTIEMARKSDVAIFGMASLNRDALLYKSGLINDSDLEELEKRGIVGSILGRFFDETGNEADTHFKNCSISVSWNDFLSIPERIAVLGGAEKSCGTRTLLRAGVITTLILDSLTAQAILNEAAEDQDNEGADTE